MIEAPRCLVSEACACLLATDPAEKVQRTHKTAEAWWRGILPLDNPMAPPPPAEPGRPARPRLVPPRAVARRRLGNARGRAAFVHALAHIEHNAIGLAWDCVARFREMPRAFYDDWVRVADDEARHFEQLCTRLHELGAEYGDFDAHDGLWEVARRTADDLAARLALVPRVLEARALDVTPGMIARLEATGDRATAAILKGILADEERHVAVGSRWYHYVCRRRGLDPAAVFRDLAARYWRGRLPEPIDLDARRRAGFTEAELAPWRRRSRKA